MTGANTSSRFTLISGVVSTITVGANNVPSSVPPVKIRCTLPYSFLHVPVGLLRLQLVDHGTYISERVTGIPAFQYLDRSKDLFQHSIIDRAVYQHPLDRDADLPGVDEPSCCDPVCSKIKIRILMHNHRCIPSQFQSDFFSTSD